MFIMMPFGLKNESTVFMRLMNSVFQEYMGEFVIFFMEDILVHSKTAEEQ